MLIVKHFGIYGSVTMCAFTWDFCLIYSQYANRKPSEATQLDQIVSATKSL